MTNFEKYKNKILNIEGGIALSEGKIVSCRTTRCENCSFQREDGKSCNIELSKWLYEDDGEDPDGCDGCKYEHKREDESPCTECSNNYTSKWERKPKKTRQEEFLEMFPEARMRNRVVEICPKALDVRFNCEIQNLTRTCSRCCRDYWLQEVEE